MVENDVDKGFLEPIGDLLVIVLFVLPARIRESYVSEGWAAGRKKGKLHQSTCDLLSNNEAIM